MALSFSEILARFPSAKRIGQEYEAFCPVHEQGSGHKTPSLHLREGDTHVAVLLCRTQRCSTKAILDAVGLTWDDISQPPPTKERYERVHVYRDEEGRPLYRVIVAGRDPDGKKIVWQEHYDGDRDRFEKGMSGIRVVPYRLNELRGHARLFIAEGEQKCDRLWRLGVPATCNVGGAKKWRESDTQAVKAAGCQRAILLPDNDDTGQAHVELVTKSLTNVGIHALTLPPFDGVGPKGDVVDWLNAGHTVTELEALILQVPKPTSGPNGTNGHSSLALVSASAILDFVPDPIQWVVDGYLAARSVCLLIARPKVGKTTLARALAVAIAQGHEFLGAAVHQGIVWYLAFEGRFEDHRAHFVQLGLARDDPLQFHCAPATSTAVDEVFAAATEAKPRLIIVDTMQKFLQAHDVDAYSEMSLQMGKIERLAHDAGAAVVALHHMGKYGDDGGSGSADTPLGSTAIEGGVDDTWMMRRYPQYRTLAMRGRHKDFDEHLLVLVDDGTLRLGQDREAEEVRRYEDELRIVITEAPEGLTEPALFQLVAGRRQMKFRALRNLVTARTVVRRGEGRRGKPFVYVLGAEGSGNHREPETPDGGSGDLDFEV